MQTNPRLNIRQVTWANPVGADLRAAQQAELGRPLRHAATTNPARRRRKLTRPCSSWRTTRRPGSRWAAAACGILDQPRPRSSGSTCCHTPAARAWPAPSWRPWKPTPTPSGITPITAEAGSAQPDGRNFYQNSGFGAVPNFGPYVGVEHSYCYAKAIDSHSAAHTAMA